MDKCVRDNDLFDEEDEEEQDSSMFGTLFNLTKNHRAQEDLKLYDTLSKRKHVGDWKFKTRILCLFEFPER